MEQILAELSEKSGIQGKDTNHWLRETAITQMFNKGVPEKVIADQSGHRSIEALRCYEHASTDVEKAAEEVIANPNQLFQVNPLCTLDTQPLPELDMKPPVEDDVKPNIKQANLPGFSGALSNYTFNIYISYGKNWTEPP